MLPHDLPAVELSLINRHQRTGTSFPGDNSGLEPPDPISNSEVKRTCAHDSVRSPHVKVGHCQGFILKGSF